MRIPSPSITLLALLAFTSVGCGDVDGSPPPSTTATASTTAGPPTDAESNTMSASATASSGSAAATGNASTSTSTSDGDTGTTDDDGGEPCVDDHRVVAFLANWTECPTTRQLAQYSHAVVAFAVTYTWDPNGNICDPSCTIAPLQGCEGTNLTALVAQLHEAGVRVLLSFGGAGMGGVWEGTCGAMTRCWDHCLDRAAEVAEQLVEIVLDNDLDGVDIDYEYCLDDPSYTGFVADLTTALRAALDAAFPEERKLLTHAPMDSELTVGAPYYEIVRESSADIDFLMPQYYNGGLSPFTTDGLSAIHDHYGALVEGVFRGDASRVVFGYCLEPGCSPVATQPEALQVAETLDARFPRNGGIFFWAHPHDTNGWFSQPFRSHYDATICPP